MCVCVSQLFLTHQMCTEIKSSGSVSQHWVQSSSICLFYPHVDWTKTHTHAHTHTKTIYPAAHTRASCFKNEWTEEHIWPSYDINDSGLCFIYSWEECINVCPTPLNPLTSRSITTGSILKLYLYNHWRLSVRTGRLGGVVTLLERTPGLSPSCRTMEWS